MPATVNITFLALASDANDCDLTLQTGHDPMSFNSTENAEICARLGDISRGPPRWLSAELDERLGRATAADVDAACAMALLGSGDTVALGALSSDTVELAKWLVTLKRLIHTHRVRRLRINGRVYDVRACAIKCAVYYTELPAGTSRTFVAAGVNDPRVNGRRCLYVKDAPPKVKGTTEVKMVQVTFESRPFVVEFSKLRPLHPQDNPGNLVRPNTSIDDGFCTIYNRDRRHKVWTNSVDGAKQIVEVVVVTRRGTTIACRDGTTRVVPVQELAELVVVCTVSGETSIADASGPIIDGAVYGLHEADDARLLIKAAVAAASFCV
jgi:hypothetical protein